MGVALAQKFRVLRPTIYKVIDRAQKQEFESRESNNERLLQARYGMKRLVKVERAFERKQKLAARRDNKSFPSEMIHFATKCLPFLTGENKTFQQDYLFVAIVGDGALGEIQNRAGDDCGATDV